VFTGRVHGSCLRVGLRVEFMWRVYEMSLQAEFTGHIFRSCLRVE